MKTPLRELKRRAREDLTGHYKIPMGAYVLAGLIAFLIELPFSMLLQGDYATLFQTILYYIAEILIALLCVVLTAGKIDISLRMARAKEYRLSCLFGQFKNRPDRYLVAGFILMIFVVLLMVPGVAVSVIALLYPTTWRIIFSIFLLLAGIVGAIYLSLRLAFVWYVLVDEEELTPWQAIVFSAELARRRTGRLFVLYISFAGYLLLTLLTLGIGTLWAAPYLTQTITQFYLDIRSEKASVESACSSTGSRHAVG